jgi:hypothetical protein
MGVFGGVVRQFVVDDKGCVMIAAFGLPQYSYEVTLLSTANARLCCIPHVLTTTAVNRLLQLIASTCSVRWTEKLYKAVVVTQRLHD